MTSCHCCATDQQFDRRIADRDLRRFLRRGPDPATRQLLTAVQQCTLPSHPTLLDIGGGIGIVHHTLLDCGFGQAIQIDASQAYLAVASTEAARRGHADRVTFTHADFRTVAATTPAAAVVTLDRVVCCDPDYVGLLGSAADHAKRLLAFTYPRARWYTRLFVATMNGWRRLLGHPFRAYIHPPAAMRAVLEDRGLRRRWTGATWIWHADLFERAG
ncbi:MAG TPA: class I SAM-dependent methyltransferase [Gemmatimonadales bacterium]|nr:class I SAM-dependent methyltransferase [Gemmatimonadales bacterium]